MASMVAPRLRDRGVRLAFALLVVVAVTGGVAWWLSRSDRATVDAASDLCHENVVASESLPLDTPFSDFELRSSGDGRVVRGTAAVNAHPSISYSCTVRPSGAGSFDVRMSLDGGTPNSAACETAGSVAG